VNSVSSPEPRGAGEVGDTLRCQWDAQLYGYGWVHKSTSWPGPEQTVTELLEVRTDSRTST